MVVFLTTCYMLDILFHSDSPRSSGTGIPKDQVCCVNLSQTISDRTDCPLLVRKPLYKYVWDPITFFAKEFNR